MQPFSFYHAHLEDVSRSFSFCISELASPSKEWVALSYLLLRVVDTIEDLPWRDHQAQKDAFTVFMTFLKQTPSKETLLAWIARFPEPIIPAEKKLLQDTILLLEDKQQLPDALHAALDDTIAQMIAGMNYFLSEYREVSKITFPSLVVTNQYCFFVAGIVGKLLSTIFTYTLPKFEWSPILLNQSLHFGLFLQKINLLKDLETDMSFERHYIASRKALRSSLIINAYYAKEYIKSIPIIEGRAYRLFCAWSLFIGLASLKWLDKGTHQKLERRETFAIIQLVNQLIDDNAALEQLWMDYHPEQPDLLSFSSETHETMPSWFHVIYPEGEAIHWHELGML